MSAQFGRRVVLRPLVASDFSAWREVRRRNEEWLTKWEPSRIPGQPDVVEDKDAFAVRCSARQRERQLGTGYGYGVFVDGNFGGEINLSSVQRGPFQSAYVGYWIDEKLAGNGYTPEAVVDLWIQRLIGRPIAPEARDTLIEALNGQPNREDNVRRMVQLIVSMPEYQLC